MTWEEKLLFLMFLDYKGALKKWEKNHNSCTYDYHKIEDIHFYAIDGFFWDNTEEGYDYWDELIADWSKSIERNLEVRSLDFEIKKDALRIADFIYECFGEDV